MRTEITIHRVAKTDLRKAVERALEALDCLPWQASPIAVEATKALRQALAQPEQEPVGWYDSISGEIDFTCYKPFRKPSFPSAEWIPVYTAPPKKEWVGLSDADIAQTMLGSVEGSNMLPYQFARAIEAKLKEKNT